MTIVDSKYFTLKEVPNSRVYEITPQILMGYNHAHPIVSYISKVWYEDKNYARKSGAKTFCSLIESICEENKIEFYVSEAADPSETYQLDSLDNHKFHIIIPDSLNVFLTIKYS